MDLLSLAAASWQSYLFFIDYQIRQLLISSNFIMWEIEGIELLYSYIYF